MDWSIYIWGPSFAGKIDQLFIQGASQKPPYFPGFPEGAGFGGCNTAQFINENPEIKT